MRATSIVLILAVLLTGSGTRAQGPAATSPATRQATTMATAQEEKVAAAIVELGGKIKRADDAPNGAIVEVTFDPKSSQGLVNASLRQFSALGQLRTLKVAYGTQLRDPGIMYLAGMKQLRSLTLDGTQLSDLECLGGLHQLQVLSLQGTQVTGAGFGQLKGLKQLQTLQLDGTQVDDAGLEQLKGLDLGQLEVLSLNMTKVGDAGLVHLKGLKQLQRLSLGSTRVSDAGLEQLAGMENLRTLYLTGTKVTAGGVAKLKAALPKCIVQK